MTRNDGGRGRRVLVTLGGPASALAPRALAETGLVVDEHLESVGIVTGWADDDTIERLRAIEGVTVEYERGVQIAPPDAPVQ